MVDVSLKKLDRSNMYDRIEGFYKQLMEGLEIGRNVALPDIDAGKMSNIILAGMGGSAIGGELLKSFLKAELKVPFIIHRNYNLPAVVNKDSLLICSSYSGGTEETLSAFDSGQKVGCKILCITTGGKLGEKAEAADFNIVKIPEGMMPREALGYSFTPLLTIFHRLGLCRDYANDISACAGYLNNQAKEYTIENQSNRAYELAQKLHGNIVVIYTGPDYLDAVGMRIKGQINENAKQHAFCNVFPEFNHNELVGWELASSITKRFFVIIIRDKQDHPKISQRMDIVKNILTEKGIGVIELSGTGESLLSRMFSLIQLGDYISYYMALINGVDPTPIDVIQHMKNRLE